MGVRIREIKEDSMFVDDRRSFFSRYEARSSGLGVSNG